MKLSNNITSFACVSCGNYGALKGSDFCEAKNFRARRRRGRPPEATDAGAVRNAGRASKTRKNILASYINAANRTYSWKALLFVRGAADRLLPKAKFGY